MEPKKRRKQSDIPLCKYGDKCYRKNTDHFINFRHSISKVAKPELSSEGESSSPEKQVQCEIAENKVSDDIYSDDSKEDSAELSAASDTQDDKNSPNCKERVADILKRMPQDFFDFWDFCRQIHEEKPEDIFQEIGYHLGGAYHLLSKKYSKHTSVNIMCHWRYYYDPPEFQTVIKRDGKDLFHIGYFRDDPNGYPPVVASTSTSLGAKFKLMGDNVFAAMNAELSQTIPKLKSKSLQDEFTEIHTKLKKFAETKTYSLDTQTPRTKARNKKVVAKTFHGFGIVVPVVNDIGYRELPDSDATMKRILKKISSAPNEEKRLEYEEALDEIMSNIQFANDECDYGMGLELGIDIFCFGDTFFHPHLQHILPLAYKLLKRPLYAESIKYHLCDRKKDGHLVTLDT